MCITRNFHSYYINKRIKSQNYFTHRFNLKFCIYIIFLKKHYSDAAITFATHSESERVGSSLYHINSRLYKLGVKISNLCNLYDDWCRVPSGVIVTQIKYVSLKRKSYLKYINFLLFFSVNLLGKHDGSASKHQSNGKFRNSISPLAMVGEWLAPTFRDLILIMGHTILSQQLIQRQFVSIFPYLDSVSFRDPPQGKRSVSF